MAAFVALALAVGHFMDLTPPFGLLAAAGFVAVILGFFAVGYRWSESFWT